MDDHFVTSNEGLYFMCWTFILFIYLFIKQTLVLYLLVGTRTNLKFT